MHTTRASALQADINVTPLVDVCLVLLIIFMVVTPLIVTGIPVQLPDARHGGPVAHEPLQVTIESDGTVFIGANVIRKEELANALQRAHANANRPVIVRGDKSLPYGEIVSVLDACRAAGFDQVALGTARK
jgi:biopolymer transport protein ExbD